MSSGGTEKTPDPVPDPTAWLLELRERFSHRNWDSPVRIVALGNINTAPAFVNCTVGQLLALVSSQLESQNQVTTPDHWRADR